MNQPGIGHCIGSGGEIPIKRRFLFLISRALAREMPSTAPPQKTIQTHLPKQEGKKNR